MKKKTNKKPKQKSKYLEKNHPLNLFLKKII